MRKVCRCVEAGGGLVLEFLRKSEKNLFVFSKPRGKKAAFILVERLNQSQQPEQVFSHLNPPMDSLPDALLLACSELILSTSAIGRLILLSR